MISTAGAICGAADVLHAHGLLFGPAIERFKSAPFKSTNINDSIPLTSGKMLPNIQALPVASVLGQAITRIHRNESVSMMFQ